MRSPKEPKLSDGIKGHAAAAMRRHLHEIDVFDRINVLLHRKELAQDVQDMDMLFRWR